MAVDAEEMLVSADAAELDLTNAHLHTLEDVPIPETLSVSQPSPETYGARSQERMQQHLLCCSCLISPQIG